MTGLYLKTLLVMHTINIFLNWVLIFGNLGMPEMGVTGAGIATTISQYCGTVLYFYFAFGNARDKGFMERIPSRETLRQQLKISLPASMQQVFFAGGMVTLIWIISQIGTAELAALNVLLTFHITATLPALGLALAAATLVGNALGRKDEKEAALWGWNVAALTLVYAIGLGVILLPFSDLLLGVFLKNPDTRRLALLPMILWALTLGFDAVGMILMNAMIGAGDTRRSLYVSVVAQWGFFLPVAYIAGPVLGLGLLGVWIVNLIYRAGQAYVYTRLWSQGKWATVKI